LDRVVGLAANGGAGRAARATGTSDDLPLTGAKIKSAAISTIAAVYGTAAAAV